MKLSLKNKLILNHTILIFVFVTILIFTSNYIFRREFNNYIYEKHNETCEKIVNEVLLLYEDGNEPTYEQLYNIGLDALDSGMVFMLNKTYDEQIICMSDIIPTDSQNMLGQMEDTMKSIYPHFDGEYQEDIYVLEQDGQNYGYVTLGYYGPIYYSEFDALFLKSFNKAIYILGIIFFIITSIFIYFIANKISKPITFVSGKAKEMENGNYGNTIEMTSSTLEIMDLIKSVNSLTRNLNNQQAIKKQMAQNYTHEIRTPLTSVMTTLEGMKDGVFEITDERLETIYNELSRIISLVENADTLVETSNSVNLVKSDFDLRNNIEKLIKSFESQFDARNMDCEFVYNDKIKFEIFADEEKINSVIYNLISNACKYTDDNGKIRVLLEKDKNNFVIKVIDSGIGIDEKDKELIFEHLYRVDKSRVRNTNGHGVGLSICKNIVLAHNGTIIVNSEIGKGSEFIITLPDERE